MSMWVRYKDLLVTPVSGSVSCNLTMGFRGTGTVTFQSDTMDGDTPPALLVPVVEGLITVWDWPEAGTAHCVFRGRIHRIEKVRHGTAKSPADQGLIRYLCSFVSLEGQLQNRFIPYARYSGTSSGDVVKDILETYAVGSVQQPSPPNWDYIEDGVSAEDLGAVLYAGVSVYDAIEDLAARSKYIWYLDTDNGYLHFSPQKLITTGDIAVTASNALFNTPRIITDRADHFNKVSIAIGWDAFSPETATFTGDGASMTFNVEEGSPAVDVPIDHIVGITLNGADQDFGILDLDTRKQWYYTAGDSLITQATTSPSSDILTAADTLVVTFYRGGANVIAVQDTNDITALGLAQDASGIVEAWIEDTACVDYDAGLNKALQFLAAHCPHTGGSPAPDAGQLAESYTFNVRSLSAGAYSLIPGMIVPVNIVGEPSTGGTIQALITDVSISSIPSGVQADDSDWRGRDVLEYSVSATRYMPTGNYLQFYQALAETRGGEEQRKTKISAVARGMRVTLGYEGVISAVDGFADADLGLPDGNVFRVSRAIASVTVAPTGADIKVDAEYSTDGGSSWLPVFDASTGVVVVPAGLRQMTDPYATFAGSAVTIDLPARCLVRGNMKQVGSTVAGSDLKLQLIGDIVLLESPE